jgi:uncharacterized membrane protein YfcA
MYQMQRTIGLLLVGLVAGLFGGALGMSAATVIVPALLMLGLIRSYKMAIGTAVLTILPPLSILALMKYYKEGLVDVHASLLLMVSATVGAGIGAYITVHHATPLALARTTAFIYAAAALIWFYLARAPVVRVGAA